MSLPSRLSSFLFTPEDKHIRQDEDFFKADYDGRSGSLTRGSAVTKSSKMSDDLNRRSDDIESARPPYLHAMLAGGLGGTTGDILMHSIDTVKTRQQGDLNLPPKYTSLSSSYTKILRQEGIRRGLYGGVFPAFLGSFPGTIIFFGTYEYSKRQLIDAGVNQDVAYLSGGFIADLAASFVYVPSEVLKTRLQLQGRYNNPYFASGYNYRSTFDAIRTIVRNEGFLALFSGYKATIFRDLPFSALQFAFYEKGQKWAKKWVGGNSIGLRLEILTGAAAGGLAGIITCPLDVVKTRIQTQVNATGSRSNILQVTRSIGQSPSHYNTEPIMQAINNKRQAQIHSIASSSSSSLPVSSLSSISPPKSGVTMLDTSSVLTGLRLIYKTEGITGLFRGVGPRVVWTSVQSGTMLVLYQTLLRQLGAHPFISSDI